MTRTDDTESDRGHLFVVRGDVTNIVCHGWLLPADVVATVEEPWKRSLDKIAGGDVPEDRIRVDGELARIKTPLVCQELKGFHRPNQGSPWVTDIASTGEVGYKGATDGLRTFVRSVRREVTPENGRLRLAIPFIGSKGGGWDEERGQLMLKLVETIADETSREDSPDIVLVLSNDEAFAAAQYARREIFERREERIWPQLDPDAEELADRLAQKALNDELVVFIGAGVSSSAELLSWNDLLEALAADAGIPIGDDFRKLQPLDRAWLIEQELARADRGTGSTLGDRVKAKFPENMSPSLTHQILASLPVKEIATTNYDCLFEDAAAAAENPVKLIAAGAPDGRSRWLVKLHGTTSKPESIVLSRRDYLNYSSQRAALAGVVQAMLLTRHMLFVGFSLTDDNFLKIAHDVRNAMGERSEGAKPVGTALTLSPSNAFATLWSDFIEIKSVGDGKLKGRGIEILLDAVLAKSVAGRMSYLLNPNFGALLSESDQRVGEALRDAASKVGDLAGSNSAKLLRDFLKDLGLTLPTP